MTNEAEGLDLDALEKVAREATPGDREAWSSIYEGMTAAIVVPGCDPLKTIAEVRSHYDDAVFLATFDPPTALRLLAALRAQAEQVRVLEGEVEAWKLKLAGANGYAAGADVAWGEMRARAEAAERRAGELEALLKDAHLRVEGYRRTLATREREMQAVQRDGRGTEC